MADVAVQSTPSGSLLDWRLPLAKTGEDPASAEVGEITLFVPLQSDGSRVAASADTYGRLTIWNGHVYLGKRRHNAAADFTYEDLADHDSHFLGFRLQRPGSPSNNQYFFSDIHLYFERYHGGSWHNRYRPTGYVGHYGTQEEAEAHLDAVGDVAVWVLGRDGTGPSAKRVTALPTSTNPWEYYWDPVTFFGDVYVESGTYASGIATFTYNNGTEFELDLTDITLLLEGKATTSLDNLHSALSASAQETIRDKLDALDRKLDELSDSLTTAEQEDIRDKIEALGYDLERISSGIPPVDRTTIRGKISALDDELEDLSDSLTSGQKEAARDKLDVLDREMEDLSGNIPEADRNLIKDKLGIERAFRSTVLGSISEDFSIPDTGYKSTGIQYPADLLPTDWLLVRVNHGQYHWIHGDEVLDAEYAVAGSDVDGSGVIRDLYGLEVAATGGSFDASATVPVVSGGTGTDAVVGSITVNSDGDITEVDWESGGSGYAAGDTITFTQGAVTGTYTLSDGDGVTDDNRIVRYLELFLGQARRLDWGHDARRYLLIQNGGTSSEVAGDIEVRLFRELATDPASEHVLDHAALSFPTNAGNASRNATFRFTREFTEDDDGKLFGGDVRFRESTDGRDRDGDRSPFVPVRCQRLRELYAYPMADRGDSGGELNIPVDYGSKVRLFTTRNHRDTSSHVDAYSIFYCGQYLTNVEGAHNAAATDIVLDSVLGISVGDTLIITEVQTSNVFTEFLLVEAIDTSTRTVTVARNQAGTHVETGQRLITNDVPVYLHDRRTFSMTPSVSPQSPPTEGDDYIDTFAEFDGWLYSYGDDPKGVEDFTFDEDSFGLALTLRDGTAFALDLSALDSSEQAQESGVAEITNDLVEVTLWADVTEGTTPADPTVAWRFDGGWRAASDSSPFTGDPLDASDSEWGDWTQDLPSTAVASGETRWSARRQFTRTENDDGDYVYGTHGDWAKLVDFDTQYSEDRSSWHDDQEDDDIWIRMRDDNGEWVEWLIGSLSRAEEVMLGWSHAYSTSSGHVRSSAFDYDLRDFEYIRIEFLPFSHWGDDDNTVPATTNVAYSATIHRTDTSRVDGTGFPYVTINAFGTLSYNNEGTYAMRFDAFEGYLQAIPIRFDHTEAPGESHENESVSYGGTSQPLLRKGQFAIRFRQSGSTPGVCSQVHIGAFQANYQRALYRIVGKRG